MYKGKKIKFSLNSWIHHTLLFNSVSVFSITLFASSPAFTCCWSCLAYASTGAEAGATAGALGALASSAGAKIKTSSDTISFLLYITSYRK